MHYRGRSSIRYRHRPNRSKYSPLRAREFRKRTSFGAGGPSASPRSTSRNHRADLEASIPRLLKHPTPPFAFQRQLEEPTRCKTWERLPQIKAPTLVITGAKDVLIPAKNSELLASEFRARSCI